MKERGASRRRLDEKGKEATQTYRATAPEKGDATPDEAGAHAGATRTIITASTAPFQFSDPVVVAAFQGRVQSGGLHCFSFRPYFRHQSMYSQFSCVYTLYNGNRYDKNGCTRLTQ